MTEKKYHFIAGLPRSGSTLLSALLKQNPRFNANISSPVAPLASAMIKLVSAGTEISLSLNENQKRNLLKSIFNAYYSEPCAAEVLFDTNRAWCSKMALLDQLFPEAKVIACVRDIPWVMDSIERLLLKNPFENTKLFSSESERSTVYSRMATLAKHDRLIGFPWAALKEAYYGAFSHKLLLVEYDLLVRSPEKVLKLIYQFTEEPWFDGHDFENVDFEAPEFDEALGLAGLHTVRKKVAPIEREPILPPDIFEKYINMAFWRNDERSRSSVIKPTSK